MPKTLYLVRHAKSDWNNSLNDFDRPLNNRGKRNAPEMGKRLKKRNVKPDLIVCSPAQRTIETLDLLDVNAGKVEFNEDIYEASVGDLMYIIRSLEDSTESVMLIGHNPAMTWLTEQLTGAALGNMPTCSIATIQLTSNHWSETGIDGAQLLDFDYPKKG